MEWSLQVDQSTKMLLLLSECVEKVYKPHLHTPQPLALLMLGRSFEGDHLQRYFPLGQTWARACQRLEEGYAKEVLSSEGTELSMPAEGWADYQP